ncbi:MAG: XrtN system VIT domain-containing protein, partial [Bacteroidetes bacterium]|nr:XrtN system VIT domain-containing protein [Bacteroidota bacterium]
VTEFFDPEFIYLDINSGWTEKEINEVLSLFPQQQVFFWPDSLVHITNENKNEMADYLREQNFSLFPLYEIRHPENALIVTKSGNDVPALEDISGSAFYCKTYEYLGHTSKKVKIFDLGTVEGIYMKTLREFRAIDYTRGNTEYLAQLIASGQFPVIAEGNGKAAIETSGTVIIMDTIEQKGLAPDHLMRLYAYNTIMQQVGRNWFRKDYINNEIVNLAKEAYVVSPVSGLVVLETTADYERFDIEEPDASQSLLNAATESTGAVPEPHEWALICITIITAGLLFLNRRRLISK